jgi:hypothetical protein
MNAIGHVASNSTYPVGKVPFLNRPESVAGGLSLIPGAGAAAGEVLAVYREEQSKRNFDMFAARIELLEARLGPIAGAEEYLHSGYSDLSSKQRSPVYFPCLNTDQIFWLNVRGGGDSVTQ